MLAQSGKDGHHLILSRENLPPEFSKFLAGHHPIYGFPVLDNLKEYLLKLPAILINLLAQGFFNCINLVTVRINLAAKGMLNPLKVFFVAKPSSGSIIYSWLMVLGSPVTHQTSHITVHGCLPAKWGVVT